MNGSGREDWPSPADEWVDAIFAGRGLLGVTTSRLVDALVAVTNTFQRTDGVLDSLDPATPLGADVPVDTALAGEILSLLTCSPRTVQSRWDAHWRKHQMGEAMVPHGPSAAEFTPLLELEKGRFVAPTPRSVAIACERLIDDLVLGREGVWAFGGQSDQTREEIRHSRGQALELATASALRTALTTGPHGDVSLVTGINYATKVAGRWHSEGELDVLAGSGEFQITIECKAGDYNGRDTMPNHFVTKPLQQLATWREAARSQHLRFAADNQGAPLEGAVAQEVARIAGCPIRLDMCLTLDDFGLLPTAAALLWERDVGTEIGHAPIYMCLPDFWDACEVLAGRDLLTYLTQRSRLMRTGVVSAFAEDALLSFFLMIGHIWATNPTALLDEASRDPMGLFAWKRKRMLYDQAVARPVPRRTPSHTRLLASLIGPNAEVGHVVLAPLWSQVPDIERRLDEIPVWIGRSPLEDSLVVLDRLAGSLNGWAQSEVYIEQLLECFRSDSRPRLVVSMHVFEGPSQVSVFGDPRTLCDEYAKLRPLNETVRDKRLMGKVRRLKLDPYRSCPCGSGTNFKWCKTNHPLPLNTN